MNNRFRFNCYDKSDKTYMRDIQKCFSLDDVFSNEDCVVLQHTGLFDKNNKPIVEGDIVRETFLDDNVETSDLMTVVYDKKACAFGFKFTKDVNYLVGYDFIQDNFEVVGNIYESPELVENI